MSQSLTETPDVLDECVRKEVEEAVENLVTEDDEPVDNIYSAKQQRLLVEPLYSSWTPPPDKYHTGEPRQFLADANVGVFAALHQPPLVPDMFLSLDVRVPDNWHEKSKRSYFLWEFGKAPEVVVEIVSNRKGNELGSKLRDYARIAVMYYVVFDPARQLGEETLHVFKLSGRQYEPLGNGELSDVGLSVKLWAGSYEDKETTWLRWHDAQGTLIPTGAERAKLEAERADRQSERANLEAERANRESERAARLAAKLREMGIDPDTV
jgi:Uma2 family endonuclease